jgi:hypothetical protein
MTELDDIEIRTGSASIAANGTTVTFPNGAMCKAPHVVCTPAVNATVWVTAVTAAGFTATASIACTVYYVAVANDTI